jgi:hypothetical protein
LRARLEPALIVEFLRVFVPHDLVGVSLDGVNVDVGHVSTQSVFFAHVIPIPGKTMFKHFRGQ